MNRVAAIIACYLMFTSAALNTASSLYQFLEEKVNNADEARATGCFEHANLASTSQTHDPGVVVGLHSAPSDLLHLSSRRFSDQPDVVEAEQQLAESEERVQPAE
jgi:hypothetical protein